MFRVKQAPIIRSSIKLYLQHLVLINRVWPAVVVDDSELVAVYGGSILNKSVILLDFFLEFIHDARNDEHKKKIQDSCIPTPHVCFLITGSQVRQYTNKI
jgi:hypothetical protein